MTRPAEPGLWLDAHVAEKLGATGLLRVRRSWPVRIDEYIPGFNMGLLGEPLRHAGLLTLDHHTNFTAEDGGRLTGGIGMYFAAPFSTDIAAAFQLVAWMAEHANTRYKNLSLTAYCYNRTYATFDSQAFTDYADDTWGEGNGDHATPFAICIAALKALETAGAIA